MTIIYISSHTRIPSKGANSVHLMRMCEAYANHNHSVTLLVSNNKDRSITNCADVHAHYGVKNNFGIAKMPVPKSNVLRFATVGVGMPLYAKWKSPTLVHSRNLTSAWSCAKWMKLPTIYELHDAPDKSAKARNRFIELLRSPGLRGIVTITGALQDYIKPYLQECDVPVLIAPDGVTGGALLQNTDRQEERKNLGIAVQKKNLAVYTGHLYPGRGVELIINIARELADYEFLIVGGREHDIKRCKQLASDLSNINFLGFRPPSEIAQFQRAADVLLMPYADMVSIDGKGDTASFASPLKMFEYMGSGRPIVSSTLPVLSEILTNGENAIMVPYSDTAGWITSLRRLADNPEYGNTIAAAAFRDVEKYTWDKRASRILDFAFN